MKTQYIIPQTYRIEEKSSAAAVNAGSATNSKEANLNHGKAVGRNASGHYVTFNF